MANGHLHRGYQTFRVACRRDPTHPNLDVPHADCAQVDGCRKKCSNVLYLATRSHAVLRTVFIPQPDVSRCRLAVHGHVENRPRKVVLIRAPFHDGARRKGTPPETDDRHDEHDHAHDQCRCALYWVLPDHETVEEDIEHEEQVDGCDHDRMAHETERPTWHVLARAPARRQQKHRENAA